jgi:5'(3')-deoxyribonucleotidase
MTSSTSVRMPSGRVERCSKPGFCRRHSAGSRLHGDAGPLRVALDLDNTTGDFTDGFRQFLGQMQGMTAEQAAARFPDPHNYEYDVSGWFADRPEFRAAFHDAEKDGIYAKMPMYVGAREALQELVADGKVEIHVVTARDKKWQKDTLAWLQANNVPFTSLTHTEAKELTDMDVYIDDANHQLTKLRDSGKAVIAFNQLYNTELDETMPRVNSWADIPAVVRVVQEKRERRAEAARAAAKVYAPTYHPTVPYGPREGRKTLIVGFSGKMGAGKDFLAAKVREALAGDGAEIGASSFAAPLKGEMNDIIARYSEPDEVLARDFDIPLDKMQKLKAFIKDDFAAKGAELNAYDRTPGMRSALQYLGTEVRRSVNDSHWVDKYHTVLDKDQDFSFVTDVRFPNEADSIVKNGGIMIRLEPSPEVLRERAIKRDGFAYDANAKAHPSEVALDGYGSFDMVLRDGYSIQDTIDNIARMRDARLQLSGE